MSFRFAFLALALAFAARGRTICAQITAGRDEDTVRVTVSMNADGSRTVYHFDPPHHAATATTTGRDGNVREKIRYTLDDTGRYAKGEVFGPDKRLRFRAEYHYDQSGRLREEIQRNAKGAVRHKIVYAYGADGKETGYSVYDGAGHLLGRIAHVRTR
jgi:hypothetical protein